MQGQAEISRNLGTTFYSCLKYTFAGHRLTLSYGDCHSVGDNSDPKRGWDSLLQSSQGNYPKESPKASLRGRCHLPGRYIFWQSLQFIECRMLGGFASGPIPRKLPQGNYFNCVVRTAVKSSIDKRFSPCGLDCACFSDFERLEIR